MSHSIKHCCNINATPMLTNVSLSYLTYFRRVSAGCTA
jgi:hypothetical protein